MIDTIGTPPVFFGKLPSRGDFVRSANHPGLVAVLDRWMSSATELLADDLRWKDLYDNAPPLDFALLGTRQEQGLVGHLCTSRDAGSRRFPFVMAATVLAQQPGPFVALAPLALADAWSALQRSSRACLTEVDAAPVLAAASQELVPVGADLDSLGAQLQDFADLQTLGDLQDSLRAAGHELDVRQTVLALGLLLLPVLTSGETRLEKGLALPLPREADLWPLVAAWWLDLVVGFLGRAPFELALLRPETPLGQGPRLLLGFEGSSARCLHAMWSPQHAGDLFIALNNAQWVDELALQDYGVQKLSSYLQQQGLSMALATRTFKEAFLGI